MMRDIVASALKRARRLIVAVVGFTVLLFGVALIVLPGPAVVVIPIGLAILATEFAWARRLLHRLKSEAERRLRGKAAGDRQSGPARD